MWIITLIITLCFWIWLNSLIRFACNRADRIAIATETTALVNRAIFAALSPEARERAKAALAASTPAPKLEAQSSGWGFLIAVAVVSIVGALFAASFAHAGERDETRSFYDKSGSFSGSSIQHGNSTSVYDKAGKFEGTVIKNSDGTTSFYDKSGKFTGSSHSTMQPR